MRLGAISPMTIMRLILHCGQGRGFSMTAGTVNGLIVGGCLPDGLSLGYGLQTLPDLGQLLSPASIGEKAVMVNTHKPGRQNMQ
jgi:hypothetical protein